MAPRSGEALPPDVVSTLRSLVPSRALNEALRPRSRAPGSLSWRQVVVDEPSAAHLLGFPPPVLPSLRGRGVVEHLSFHGGMDPVPDLRQLRFQAVYLPVPLEWGSALRFSVVDGATIVSWRTEHPGDASRAGRLERVSSSRADPDRPAEREAEGFTVVRVGGVEVGVQVGASGIAAVSWWSRRRGVRCRVDVLTRRDAVGAVELVLGDGLLADDRAATSTRRRSNREDGDG